MCGDDKGTLWLYDLFDLITGGVPSPITGGSPLIDPIPPNAKMLWPDLDDPEVRSHILLKLMHAAAKVDTGNKPCESDS